MFDGKGSKELLEKKRKAMILKIILPALPVIFGIFLFLVTIIVIIYMVSKVFAFDSLSFFYPDEENRPTIDVDPAIVEDVNNSTSDWSDEEKQNLGKMYLSYYNPEADISGTGSGGGFININYSCSNGSRPHVATYTDHHGLDINSVPVGTSVYPIFEGQVVYIADSCRVNYPPIATASGGYNCSNANSHNCGYGTYVVVRGVAKDGKTYDAMYAHLSGVNVTIGQQVTMTTIIGALGNTGCSTGPHLHLELRDDYTKKATWHLPTYAGYSYVQVANVLCSRTVDEEVENEI